jgi:hypothetical protein
MTSSTTIPIADLTALDVSSPQLETQNSKLETLPAFLGASNALDSGINGSPEGESSRWLKLADYGDWPHSRGLQRLTQPAAARLAHGFKSLLGRLRRRFTGVPIYIGHPDDPSFASQPGHDDTRAYAWVSNLEARPDGLHLLARWSEPGRDLLRHSFYKFLSPRWEMRPVAPGVFEPTRLLSIGLTNHPNIPGEAVANATSTQPETANRKQETSSVSPNSSLRTLHSELPSPEPQIENSKPETFLPRLLAVLEFDPAAAPETLLSNAENLAAAAREARESQLESARFYRLCNDAQAELAAANTRADEERAGRLELLLDLAELRGQFPLAERPQWHEKLRADFPQALVALANHRSAAVRPTLAAAPLTARLVGRRPGPAGPADAQRLLTLVNERMARTGEDYSTAWNRAKRERADLFAAAPAAE